MELNEVLTYLKEIKDSVNKHDNEFKFLKDAITKNDAQLPIINENIAKLQDDVLVHKREIYELKKKVATMESNSSDNVDSRTTKSYRDVLVSAPLSATTPIDSAGKAKVDMDVLSSSNAIPATTTVDATSATKSYKDVLTTNAAHSATTNACFTTTKGYSDIRSTATTAFSAPDTSRDDPNLKINLKLKSIMDMAKTKIGLKPCKGTFRK